MAQVGYDRAVMSRRRPRTASPTLSEVPSTPWWGATTIPVDHQRQWTLGSARLWIQHAAQEWRIVLGQGAEEETGLSEAGPLTEVSPRTEDSTWRWIYESTSDTVDVRPAMADLPVVTRPRVPLHVPPGQRVTFFAGVPVWVQVLLESDSKPVVDQPLLPATYSWFGRDTRHGELCYFSKTAARLNVENLPFISHRAITPVTVRNRGTTPLVLERFQVPVLHLEVFGGEGGLLWTSPITIERDDSGGEDIHLSNEPPPGAVNPQPLAPSRERGERRRVIRALSSLFG